MTPANGLDRLGRVLVLGIYLADKENTARHVVSEMAGSQRWSVEQRWLSMGSRPVDTDLAAVTVDVIRERVPKFVLLNRLLAGTSFDDYSFIILCDDDVFLPTEFLDRYLEIALKHDFALAQPARTHDSYIDHRFVERLDGLEARRTRFVEIGPVFSVRRDAAAVILPFDEASPMGWGYDLTWPCMLADAGLKMGIVDATPVAHSLRKPVANYSWHEADAQRNAYLAAHRHLTNHEAFFIVESYA